MSESGDLGNLSILPPSVISTGGQGPFRAEQPFNRATGVLGASLECSDATQTAFWEGCRTQVPHCVAIRASIPASTGMLPSIGLMVSSSTTSW